MPPKVESLELVIRELKLVQKLVCQRRDIYEAQKKMAIQTERWSQVAGFDGMAIGLIAAESVLRDQIKENERRLESVQRINRTTPV